MRQGWPDEVNAWLIANVPGKTTKEVTELINRQGFDKLYGMTFTESMIKGAKNRLHIKSGTPGGLPKGTSLIYPEGMEDYIRSIAEGRKTDEIARMTSEHFGITFTARQCRAYKKNHEIVSGVDCRFVKGQEPPNKGKKMSPEQYEKCKGTMFKKGNVPANHADVGDYSHTTDGYLIRKVQEHGIQRERWIFVHREEWEKHNGPIPEGKMVSFLDGDKDNCSIENLVLVDNEINLEMNRKKLRKDDPELTRVGVKVAELGVAINKARKRKKEAAT